MSTASGATEVDPTRKRSLGAGLAFARPRSEADLPQEKIENRLTVQVN